MQEKHRLQSSSEHWMTSTWFNLESEIVSTPLSIVAYLG